MRFLVIEADTVMSHSIKLTLGGAGLDCEIVTTGREGIELARVYDYDGIILDLTLPDLHGYEVLRQLRTAKIWSPVIILHDPSEPDAPEWQRFAIVYETVTKPFELAELLRYVQAMVRRCVSIPPQTIKTGSMLVDLDARTVDVSGRRVALTKKEYEILMMLSLRKGQILANDMILPHLNYGRDEPEAKIIDVFVSKLRRKLAAAGAGASECIHSIEGLGHVLRDPEMTNDGPRGT